MPYLYFKQLNFKLMYIETYKNNNIYKFNGFYQIGLNGVSCSKLDFLKMLIDKTIK